jgi:hypothetical protein
MAGLVFLVVSRAIIISVFMSEIKKKLCSFEAFVENQTKFRERYNIIIDINDFFFITKILNCVLFE